MRGASALMADADGATEIADLDKLEAALDAVAVDAGGAHGRVGVAVGSRAHMQETSVAQRSLLRTILMFGFHFFVSLLCSAKIRDTQCGFKLFTRHAAATLFSSLHLERWAFDVEAGGSGMKLRPSLLSGT